MLICIQRSKVTKCLLLSEFCPLSAPFRDARLLQSPFNPWTLSSNLPRNPPGFISDAASLVLSNQIHSLSVTTIPECHLSENSKIKTFIGFPSPTLSACIYPSWWPPWSVAKESPTPNSFGIWFNNADTELTRPTNADLWEQDSHMRC